jgi:protein tyrosine phosphatase (PTP) superfamily phosphohydrolase (DUF442 family)
VQVELKLLLIVLLLAVTGCGTVGRNEAGIENFDQVSPTVFRGAQPTQEGIHTLAGLHVQTIINLRDGDDSREAQMVRDAGMTYFRLPWDAETVTVADANRFLQLLAKAPKPVFVHCLVGRDRTGLAIAAYRVCVEGWTEQAAIADLFDHGHFWLFFPKVRAAVALLAQTRAAASHIATSALQPGELDGAGIVHLATE